MAQAATLLMSEFVTHDVRRLLMTRPEGLDWVPGQGIELMIDADEWRDQGRPFTPTCLRRDRLIELTVKRYPEDDGVTLALHDLEPGAQLLVSEGFGTIQYQGPGTFIAAGTGVTPFLAILRHLAHEDALSGNRLLLSNKSEKDVICGQELKHYLGDDCVLTFTREQDPTKSGGRIDASFLEEEIGSRDQFFYVCGPQGFVQDVRTDLQDLGVSDDRLVYER